MLWTPIFFLEHGLRATVQAYHARRVPRDCTRRRYCSAAVHACSRTRFTFFFFFFSSFSSSCIGSCLPFSFCLIFRGCQKHQGRQLLPLREVRAARYRAAPVRRQAAAVDPHRAPQALRVRPEQHAPPQAESPLLFPHGAGHGAVDAGGVCSAAIGARFCVWPLACAALRCAALSREGITPSFCFQLQSQSL